MTDQHNVDDLRAILNDLRKAIETLETIPRGRMKTTVRRRLEEAKIQEAVILTKLAKLRVKL